ncbi:hypothetical protein KAJ83_11165 [Marivibrio halodurans]|uniref:Uncharacterized protein n=1 Tax=Marivibrio halodurans TaxID=2039722 RepID=A0A8J7SNC1_9PROT|nr:hypothetical protein [Marivibrio halodurans]MBP5857571.1 hypothetical protein [Marivibrio halodurans]
MADIAGIGGGSGAFGYSPTRSAAEDIRADDASASRRFEEEATRPVQDRTEVPALDDTAADTAPADTDQETSPGGQQELAEDTVSLSDGAQQALAANDAGAPVDRPVEPGAGNLSAEGARATNETNQVARQEDTTTEVNGNQNNQSETTRTLGQLVDQFA